MVGGGGGVLALEIADSRDSEIVTSASWRTRPPVLATGLS